MKNLFTMMLLAILFIAPAAQAQLGWFEQYSGGEEILFDLDMYDASTALAVGQNGIILRTEDGGSTWTRPQSGTTEVLRRVKFRTATDVIALGYGGLMLRSTNAGRNWQKVETGSTKALFDIAFRSDTHWMVVGQAALMLESTDGGATWKKTEDGLNNYNAITFRGDFGIIAGNKGTIRTTTNGGVRWTGRDANIDLELTDVSIGDDSTAIITGVNGTILRSSDKGRAWEAAMITVPISTFRVSRVRHLTRENAIATSYSGLILASYDTGLTWTPQENTPQANLEGLDFVDHKIGMAAGWSTTILRTNTGGTLSISQQRASAPATLRILEQYPQPLRRGAGAAVLHIEVPNHGPVTITLVDVLGRVRHMAFSGTLEGGSHRVSIDSHSLPAGNYLLHIAQGGRSVTGRFSVL